MKLLKGCVIVRDKGEGWWKKEKEEKELLTQTSTNIYRHKHTLSLVPSPLRRRGIVQERDAPAHRLQEEEQGRGGGQLQLRIGG